MGADSDKAQFVALDAVDQNPVRLYMTVAAIFVRPFKRVVLVLRRERFALCQFLDNCFQVVGVLPSLDCFLHIAPELARPNDVVHCLVSLNVEVFKKGIGCLELLAAALS